jgi:DNA-binding beta-propeller fold protein YncE
MPLQHLGFVDLPPHKGAGGFDHADVHEASGRVYVAHTANDAIDVIDIVAQKYVGSIDGLSAVAGALVTESPDFVFTSNRGANTISIFTPADERTVAHIGVGIRPNGLAYDPGRGRLLSAHLGDPAGAGSHTVSIVDVRANKRIADHPVAGRTRRTVYDAVIDAFHVNIMDPAQIAVVGAADPTGITRTVPIPHAGPHGLDIDVAGRRLFCACDAGVLVEVDADNSQIVTTQIIGGVPDVVFFNPALRRLYVAIGDPGIIEVFDTAPLRRQETIATEAGTHTLSFDATRNLVCAFLPATHRAAVYVDRA